MADRRTRTQGGKAGGVFAPAKLARAEKAYAAAVEAMKAKGAEFTQFELVDYNGLLRGKLGSIDRLTPRGVAFSSVYFSATYGAEIFEADYGNYADGFPNVYGVPDLETLVHWPWQPDMASVLVDAYYEDGRPCMYCPRNVLKSIVARGEKLGLEARFGVEYECYGFEADDRAIRERRYHDLVPLGRAPDFWALHRYPSYFDFAKEFLRRMAALGAGVEYFHTELGHGALEFGMLPRPALQAADGAMRAKLYLKQLFGENGHVVTFMPVHRGAELAAGGHHHVSLWRDGAPAFHDPDTGELSELGRHFVAGLCRTLPEFHLFLRSTINTYRRLDALRWTPENNAWGFDNRCCAMRFIKGTSPASYRFENRTPGADVNPYLAIAAILAGGLHGIENALEPAEMADGIPDSDDPRWTRLATTLEGSVQALRESELAREWFGDAMVDRMIVKGEAECASWGDRDLAGPVTEWELDRYFESA